MLEWESAVGSVDVGYTTAIVDALTVCASGLRAASARPSATIPPASCRTWAAAPSKRTGDSPQWARLSLCRSFGRAGLGEATFGLSPGALQFSRFGRGNVDWSVVDLGHAPLGRRPDRRGTQIEYDDRRDAQRDQRQRRSRRPARPAGPGSTSGSRSGSRSGSARRTRRRSGVAQAAVDLQYNTAYLTATEIQYGPAFTQDLTGTIEDSLGWSRRSAGRRASDGRGRRRLCAVRAGPLRLHGQRRGAGRRGGTQHRSVRHAVGAGQRSDAAGGRGRAVPELAPPPATELWAVMYDIDDNNLIDFGDLSFFAAAFGRSAGDRRAATAVYLVGGLRQGRPGRFRRLVLRCRTLAEAGG